MTEAVPAPKLDVFLSYKREERDVAEALASYLTTQGYDVWWDAALLAGEDFVKIVHAELVEARAVVVLWSKQARSSHWVRAEAALALANGTLINAVIDGMAFEGIPPEFSSIQAVRLGEDAAKFHAEIAAAIARKGTAPSHAARSAQEATTALAGKVEDADFFRIIANSTDPEDYREYLERFGESGQFAGLARRRIATHEKARAADRSLWTLIRENGRMIGGLLSGGAALVAILVFLGIQPGREAAQQPEPVAEASAETAPATPVTSTEVAAIPAGPEDVLLLETSRTSGLSNRTEGQATWVRGATDGLAQYVADITFAWGGTARLEFQKGLISDLFAPEILLTYADSSGLGPLANVTGITGLLADGERIALTSALLNTDKLAAGLAETGRADGSFDRLVDAKTLTVELAFGEDYGTLEIGKPAGAAALRGALFPLTIAPSTKVLEMLNNGPLVTDQLLLSTDAGKQPAPGN